MRSTALLLALAACGGTTANPLPDGGPRPDAPGGADAMPACAVRFATAPASPVAPLTMTATATVDGGIGFISIAWQVTAPDGAALTVTDLDSSGLLVTFPAMTPGAYMVAATVERGARACAVFPELVNVTAQSAGVLHVRLRYLPQPGQGAPPQVGRDILQVPGGVADYYLPAEHTLDMGTAAQGTVSGPGGVGLAADLHLTLGSGDGFDLFADPVGRFATTVPPEVVMVRVAPYGDVAAQDFAAPLAASYQLDAGDAVTGTVSTSGGAPVSGARVAAATATLPALVATTGADGRFATHVRLAAGNLSSFTVVTPSGAPTLALPAPVALTAGADLDVRLPDLPTAPFAGRAVDAAGAPLPGAEVTLVATGALPGGALAIGGQPPVALAAGVRVTATAGEGGVLPPLDLPMVAWQAIVDPGGAAGQTLGVTTVEAGSPGADLAAAAPAATRVSVTDSAGHAVAGAHVVAVTAGIHGIGAGRAVSASADADGVVTLPLAPGAAYTLVVDAPPTYARARASAIGGIAPAPIALARALRLHGTVVFPAGGGQAGVGVEALCASCADPTPIAVAVTGPAGDYILYVPDPGMQ
jgi:hypothetical protein